MKYKIKETSRFRRDFKNIVRQGMDISEFKKVLNFLANGEKLPIKYKDHKLVDDNNFFDCRELHIKPDWLLVYKYSNENLILYLIRTGTHSELFKN